MTVPPPALTAAEARRIATLNAVSAAAAQIFERTQPLADALEQDALFAPGHSFVVTATMLEPLQEAAGLTPWLARHPRELRQAAGRWTLGHLLPGNHPGGVVSALLPGWLLGCRQLARPSPRLAQFTRAWVAQTAGAQCELRSWDHQGADSENRLRDFLQACDAVTVQGSDFTVDTIQSAWAALPHNRRPHLIAFAGRLSLVAVDCRAAAAVNAPADVAVALALAEQKGCLCPHGVMLVGPAAARQRWLTQLAQAVTELDADRAALPVEAALAVAYQHRVYAELARAGEKTFAPQALGGGTDGDGLPGSAGRFWPVPLTEKPLALGGRSYFIWQANTVAQAANAMAGWQTPLQAVGCFPDVKPFQHSFGKLDCWLTTAPQLHAPPPDWPQDGCDLLTRLLQV